jgi:hypothetical protein
VLQAEPSFAQNFSQHRDISKQNKTKEIVSFHKNDMAGVIPSRRVVFSVYGG